MMTLENTEGYTQADLDRLNAEFHTRWQSGEWAGCERSEAEKYFSDEIARRLIREA
jgi:hypothetical protein